MCMLVILEGLDNTGKTTIAKMLMQYYKIQGKNAILAKELSTPVGEQIKQLSKVWRTHFLRFYSFVASVKLSSTSAAKSAALSLPSFKNI